MMSLCYVAVLLLSAPIDGPGLSDGMAVELKALDARRALHNGLIDLSIEYHVIGEQPSSIPSVDLRIYFDGNRRRVEKRESNSVKTERRVFDGTLYIVEKGDTDSSERIVIDRQGLAPSTYYVFDPRLLGVYPISAVALGDCSIETVLGRADRTDEQVHIEQVSGRSVTHVSRKLLTGQVQSDLWIAPELGHSPVRMAVSSPASRSELLCEYDKPFGGVWFPRRITYRQYRHPDNHVMHEEVVTIKSAVFNRGIDPALFTLSSFKPNVGDIVREEGKLMAWNGKQLVPAHELPIATHQSSSLMASWRWFAVGTFLAIAAFAILRRSLSPNQ